MLDAEVIKRLKLDPVPSTLVYKDGVYQTLHVPLHWSKLHNYTYTCRQTGEPLFMLIHSPKLKFWPIPTSDSSFLAHTSVKLAAYKLYFQFSGKALRKEFLNLTSYLGE